MPINYSISDYAELDGICNRFIISLEQKRIDEEYKDRSSFYFPFKGVAVLCRLHY